MKYALQLYGQLRTFKQCLPSLLNFIDYYNNDYDVFLMIDKGHMENYTINSNPNYSKESMEVLYAILNINNIKCIQYTSDMTEEEISKEKQLLDEYNTLWLQFENKYKNITRNEFVTSLKYRTYLLNTIRVKYEELKSIKYDFVIRSRFDYATTLNIKYDINSKTTPIIFSDCLSIGTPEFINKESELGLVFPYTPKSLYDSHYNLLVEKYEKYKTWRGDKFIEKHWIFMPELNQRLFLLENSYEFIEAWWKEPCNYGFKIVH